MPAPFRPSILIVEDEPLIAILTEDMVADLGYDVVGTASNVLDAIGALDKRRPHIALLDIKLRSETSLAVAEHCRTLGIGVAFTTGYSARDVPDACGDAPVLAKPFSAKDLDLTLKRAESRAAYLHA
jgi:CheY-like chemotaxis protein